MSMPGQIEMDSSRVADEKSEAPTEHVVTVTAIESITDIYAAPTNTDETKQVAPGLPISRGVVAGLQGLAALFERKLLSASEFEQAKAKLLAEPTSSVAVAGVKPDTSTSIQGEYVFQATSRTGELLHEIDSSRAEGKPLNLLESNKLDFEANAVYRRIPIINYIFDMLFDTTPQFADIERLLNIIALISALILSVSAGLPTAVSYDELVAADLRFAPDDTVSAGYSCYYSSQIDPHYAVNQFSFRVTLSDMCLSLCLIGVIVVYVSLSSLDVLQLGEKHPVNQAKMFIWWRYARFVLLICNTALIVGIVSFFTSLYSLSVIKFPDYWVQDNYSCENDGNDSDLFSIFSPYGMRYYLSALVFPAMTCLIVVMVSLAIHPTHLAACGGEVILPRIVGGNIVQVFAKGTEKKHAPTETTATTVITAK